MGLFSLLFRTKKQQSRAELRPPTDNVETGLSGQTDQKSTAILQSIHQVREKNFRAASSIVSSYEAKQINKRGLGVDWSNPDTDTDVGLLTTMFAARPAILNGIAEHEWDALRVAAAMMHLWGTNRCTEWLPDGFVGTSKFNHDTACRMILFYAQTIQNISEWREMGINKVTVLSCGKDSCPACKSHSDIKFSLDDTPELPCPLCTHPMGCRCEFLPVLD